MSDRLCCPVCGNETFNQDSSLIYDELYGVKFNRSGEVVDTDIEESECRGKVSAGIYKCKSCRWELVEPDGTPITKPDEIVAKFEQAKMLIQEAFQKLIEGQTEAVDVGGEQRGLPWFLKRLTGCTGILPAGFCSDLRQHHRGRRGEVGKGEGEMIATGFDFKTLPNGDVLIEFFGDDGVTFNTQVITRESLARLPVVVHAFFLAVEKGNDEALKFLNSMTERVGNEFSMRRVDGTDTFCGVDQNDKH